jgi:hypothetical protein
MWQAVTDNPAETGAPTSTACMSATSPSRTITMASSPVPQPTSIAVLFLAWRAAASSGTRRSNNAGRPARPYHKHLPQKLSGTGDASQISFVPRSVSEHLLVQLCVNRGGGLALASHCSQSCGWLPLPAAAYSDGLNYQNIHPAPRRVWPSRVAEVHSVRVRKPDHTIHSSHQPSIHHTVPSDHAHSQTHVLSVHLDGVAREVCGWHVASLPCRGVRIMAILVLR